MCTVTIRIISPVLASEVLTVDNANVVALIEKVHVARVNTRIENSNAYPAAIDATDVDAGGRTHCIRARRSRKMTHGLGGPVIRDEGHLVVTRHAVNNARRHFYRMRAKVLERLPDVHPVTIQQGVQAAAHRRAKLNNNFDSVGIRETMGFRRQV